MDSYSKKKTDVFSRKADELLEMFMLVANTVWSQIQGMKSSIVRMQEMNEKCKKGKTNSINSTNVNGTHHAPDIHEHFTIHKDYGTLRISSRTTSTILSAL